MVDLGVIDERRLGKGNSPSENDIIKYLSTKKRLND